MKSKNVCDYCSYLSKAVFQCSKITALLKHLQGNNTRLIRSTSRPNKTRYFVKLKPEPYSNSPADLQHSGCDVRTVGCKPTSDLTYNTLTDFQYPVNNNTFLRHLPSIELKSFAFKNQLQRFAFNYRMASLKISNKIGNDSFIVSVIYRHPKRDVNDFDST